jgi:hypothetical protein
MSLDTARIIADAIHETVEAEFSDIPIKMRIKHVAKIEAINPSTVWRWYKAGKIDEPCRDDRGPWWIRDKYKAGLLKRMLAEQG